LALFLRREDEGTDVLVALLKDGYAKIFYKKWPAGGGLADRDPLCLGEALRSYLIARMEPVVTSWNEKTRAFV
jgi:hypothetical protein